MKIAHPETLQMIRALLARPSVSSAQPTLDMSNLGVIELLANWLNDLGFDVRVTPLADAPQKANLVATLGRGPGGLVLAGHTDTVPYDEALWHSDPFGGTVRGGRLYGLGASDMKSFFALAIEALAPYRDKPLQQPLILLATADEETSMAGAQAIAASGRPLGRYAVIGEPTGLRPARIHKGIMMETFRVLGSSGHSSDPALGRNALEGMYRVLGALLDLRSELQARYQYPGLTVPVPTLNLGHIHGGDNPNRICGQCELHIDLRMLPGMDVDELRTLLKARALAALADSDLTLEHEPLFAGLPPLETPAESAIVQAAEALTGYQAGAVAFGTEAPYLNQMGTESIVLGPGDIDQAHQPNEYLQLERIEPTVRLLRQLIERFCLSPAPEYAGSQSP